jgi:hypothetical protein
MSRKGDVNDEEVESGNTNLVLYLICESLIHMWLAKLGVIPTFGHPHVNRGSVFISD